MPAISRRRGSAASFLVGRPEGAPFCSGGNLRTGSAIALLLLGRFGFMTLNGVTHVFLDGFELGEKPVGVGGIDSLQRSGGQLQAEARELGEQRAGRLLQIETVDAAVVLVAAALDPAIVAELVDQPRQGNRLH